MEVDLKPLNELIKKTFVEKNRCRYSLTGKMKVNVFCKIWFVFSLFMFPFAVYFRHLDIMDWINTAKMAHGDVDEDQYTQFTPYEMFAVLIRLIYSILAWLLSLYILYVVMKECNCARISFVFWESPFWKYVGYNVLTYLLFIALSLILFARYSRFILSHLLRNNPVTDVGISVMNMGRRRTEMGNISYGGY